MAPRCGGPGRGTADRSPGGPSAAADGHSPVIRARRRDVLRGLAALSATTLLPLTARAQSDGFGPAVWMRIPSIEVDSHISEVDVIGGYYDVPWFDVGHHIDSANPGDLGNSIFNGHVVTINAGEVF